MCLQPLIGRPTHVDDRRISIVGALERIGDDTMRVEVGEDLGAEGVDELGDFDGELCAALAQLVEGVDRGRVDGEDERTERFEDVHCDLAETEGGEGDGGEDDPAHHSDSNERHIIRNVAVQPVFVCKNAEEHHVEVVAQRSEGEGDEEFPRCHDIARLDLNGGGFEGFLRFLAGDDFRGDEDGEEEQEPRKRTGAEHDEFRETVEEGEENHEPGEFGVFDLVVAEAEVTEFTVVGGDVLAKLDDAGVVFIVSVAGDQATVHFDDGGERELFVGGLVETAGGLDNHEGVVVRGGDGDGHETVVDHLEDSLNGFTFIAILVHLNQLLGDFNGRAELNNRAGAELVRMEVVHTHGHDLEIAVRVARECTKRHDCDTSYHLSAPLLLLSFGGGDLPFNGSSSVRS